MPDPGRLSLAIGEYFSGYPFQITKSATEVTPQSEEARQRMQAGIRKSRRLTYKPSSPSDSISLSRRKPVSFVGCEVTGSESHLSVNITLKCQQNRTFAVYITSASIPLDLDQDPNYTSEQLIADYLLHWVAARIVHLTVDELDGRTLGLS
jgi:hypothetical protein